MNLNTIELFSLKGKKGLIIGIANEDSIAWGCAQVLHSLGAELAVTWLNEKAKVFVEPLADKVGATIKMPLNVVNEGELENLFEQITMQWGQIDFVIHSIASAPKKDIQRDLVDSSSDGFLQAMDISCHSFIRTANLARPLMKNGGTLITMSYLGAQKVVKGYSLMAPVKAALEASVRILANELGRGGIRVHAISPGPIPTRASSGLKDFGQSLDDAIERAPLHCLASLTDIGSLCSLLVSEAGRSQTGGVHFVDGGLNIIG